MPGGDNDGMDDRDGRTGTDPEDAALFPIASGQLDESASVAVIADSSSCHTSMPG